MHLIVEIVTILKTYPLAYKSYTDHFRVAGEILFRRETSFWFTRRSIILMYVPLTILAERF